MSVVISGPKQPGNDIDVYSAPLIEDLKMLWDKGVDVLDANMKETFNMSVMLFITINDLSAYDNLFCNSVKGHKACPICESNTHFHQLKHGRKTVYLGHRVKCKWLPSSAVALVPVLAWSQLIFLGLVIKMSLLF